MKPLVTLTLFTLLASFYCLATIRTVSNDPANPAQFASIQAAVNAAAAGDTIYVNPSITTYVGPVTISKRLVMIGGGYKSSNQLGYSTTVGEFTFDRSGGDPSGSVICGFNIGTQLSVRGGFPTISNVTVFRNRIAGLVVQGGNNWLIYNNIITGSFVLSNGSIPNNIIIQNNIFGGAVFGNTGNANFLIDHNLFVGSPFVILNNIQFATITNNIFATITSATIMNSSVISNNFNNNLSVNSNIGATAPTNSFAGGPNTAAGNFVAVDPLFVNAPSGAYNANYDYRLQSSSPVKNAGTDGTDLGIYGGAFPFPSGGGSGSGFDTSALPPIPQVTSVNIQNGTLPSGAQLKVTIQATVNN